MRMPLSKSPSFRPCAKNVMRSVRSAALTGARNACVASRVTVLVAHGRSSSAAVGRHANTRLRLGVSEMPVTFIGPATTRSWMCGMDVMPKPVPMRMSTRVWSIGIIRSSTGPTKRGTKAAATRWGPALIWMAGVSMTNPFSPASLMLASTSSTATRSPFTEISSSSLLPDVAMPVLPKSSPLIVRCSIALNT